ncbi:DNA-directed RNA polymerase sigma-70 factor [Candidatus Phytoplasma luffae]|uniref:DNA-directed RNA polymerase sigma-70 factor n=1 Tax=Loofah witches'-broom phytoplasma TaxID=35773 RepID=A0A975IMA6_LOWBP|nr:sigma-70 family RNA polymerase sigma factor [Candidatus Phytoplasma luffae]QTX02595.1 DNA-directed RNA polymerase sigma-70 factor [Candidatus Phytoplasma luffae]QTX02623.1 DNA-directed RNA polymerase sigma-70 factor [Candidatus Phytoplasma luffae]QTX02732.1 DNA-directed RNA polymerase sigma-70 factor [Candidatus Phytoplasma luffae]QTX02861.1 DNA-directed RNA polymerase sigma-70 factor [Candidatus Phytoplasma luffae]QTX02914.1 DNA-directed RNA polymerase sigma-70 factor [Candidatus Phytoplas
MLRKKLFKDFLKNKKNLEIRDQLIDLHLPLINKIVGKFKYYPKLLQKQDLYQEGVLGLTKALSNYQDLGYDFIAYAKPTIKSEINELIRKSYSPSIPQKSTKPNNISFQEEKYQPYKISNPNPHQLWLKQTNHECLLKKLKKKLSKTGFNIICLSFGITLDNINETYQRPHTNQEIALKINLKLQTIINIKKIAILKLKPKKPMEK